MNTLSKWQAAAWLVIAFSVVVSMATGSTAWLWPGVAVVAAIGLVRWLASFRPTDVSISEDGE